ncbi:MAG TPA: hypothetical protein VFA18_05075 [Gemmataceae bacterium]|nr:hypothetical protein [Gemmataceae bacterium]
MIRPFILVVGLVLCSCLVGCRSEELGQDQCQFRQVLLNLYTDQIMDNLVRAHNGLPIVQLDYSSIQGSITDDVSASEAFDYTHTATKSAVVKGALTLGHTIARDLKSTLTGDRKVQLSVTANPVINNDEVYRAYLEFLSLPGSLLFSESPPPCGAAHLVRRCGDQYAWVPMEYQREFLRLALVTTVTRGQPFSVPDGYDVTIVDAIPELELKPAQKQWRIALVFNKSIPNDNGTFSVDISGKTYPFDVFIYKPLPAPAGPAKAEDEFTLHAACGAPRPSDVAKAPAYGKPTDRLTMIYSELNPPGLPAAAFAAALKGKAIKLYLQSFNPRVPTPIEDLLKQINTNVGQIRLDQLGKTSP